MALHGLGMPSSSQATDRPAAPKLGQGMLSDSANSSLTQLVCICIIQMSVLAKSCPSFQGGSLRAFWGSQL